MQNEYKHDIPTDEEARALMRHPESDDARTVIALARERFADRLEHVAVN